MRRFFSRELVRIWMQLTLACMLLIVTVGAGNTAARYNDLGHKMMCTCGCNQILLECNHVGCTVSTQEEGELRASLDRGDSDSLILQNFVQKYGLPVLPAPPETGFNLIAWIAPGIFFVLSTLLAAFLVLRWKKRAVVPTPIMDSPHMDAMRQRIRKETEI